MVTRHDARHPVASATPVKSEPVAGPKPAASSLDSAHLCLLRAMAILKVSAAAMGSDVTARDVDADAITGILTMVKDLVDTAYREIDCASLAMHGGRVQ
jgi:hypothetical protein